MSGDTRDFNNMETRVIKFFILAKQGTDLYHPPYSPDLVPSDYNLFPGLKKQLKGRHFSSDTEVIAAAETRLDG